MYLEPDGALFKRTRDDTVSLLTWVDDVEKAEPNEYWTLGHDATATFDHFELTNEQTDTTPFRVTETDKVEVGDFGVSGTVTDPLHLGATTTRLSGFDGDGRHWVHADAAGNDQMLAVEQHAEGDYTLYVSEGDSVSRVITEGDSGGGNADTLDGIDSSGFLQTSGANGMDADLTLGSTNAIVGGSKALTLGGTDNPTTLTADGTDIFRAAPDGTVRVPNGTLYQQGNAVLTTADDIHVAAQNDDGTDLVTDTHAITAGTNLTFGDDGDGTVTLSYSGTDTTTASVGRSATASGDGSQTTFTLPHDLDATPDSVDVTPTSKAASTDFWVTGVTASEVTIEYPTAPPSGTDNLSWYVTASGAGDGWTDTSVSDNGTQVLGGPTDFNFDPDLTVHDDGDNTVTIGTAGHIADTTASETVTAWWSFASGVGVGADEHLGFENSSNTEQFAWAYHETDDRAVFADVANATETIQVERDGTVNFPEAATIGGAEIATVSEAGGTTTSEHVTTSGDGNTRTFALSHGFGEAPAAAVVQPTSRAAMSDFYVTNKTSSEVVIEYANAPPDGTDNLSYDLILHD